MIDETERLIRHWIRHRSYADVGKIVGLSGSVVCRLADKWGVARPEKSITPVYSETPDAAGIRALAERWG